MNKEEQGYCELDKKMIEEAIQNSISEPMSIGNFYGLYGKEYLYHEKTLYYMLKDSLIQKKIVANLFERENLGAFEIKKLTMEKKINGSGRIDLFFSVCFKDNRQSIPVIIELKTNTNNHDCQLTRYYNFVKKENSLDPKGFYITTDGRSPLMEKGMPDYKCLSYFDIMKGISSQDPLIQDYLNTVRTNSSKKPYLISDQIQIYTVLFNKLKEKLSTLSDISSVIECTDSKGKQVEPTKEDYDMVSESLHLKLKVKKNGNTLAIEKRWKKQMESFCSSLYYGIWKDDSFDRRKYPALINHWCACGRELNCKICGNEIEEINGQRDKSINVDCWYIVQYLNSWPMPLWDNLTIIIGQSDIESWAQWINEDLDLIICLKGNDA